MIFRQQKCIRMLFSMGAVICLLGIKAGIQADPIQTDVPHLKNVYKNDFRIGCLLSYAHVGFDTDPYVPGQSSVVEENGGYLIQFHMNSMSPGNWMKSTYIVNINGSAAAYNAAGTQEDKDSIDVHPMVTFNGNIIAQLNWAERQGFTFRGHTLVWHNQNPGTAFFRSGYTINGARLTREKMTLRMENFIKEVIRIIHEGWPGLLTAMDVVNEAVNDDGSDRTANNEWFTTFGDISYVMKAFEFTRKYTELYGETQMKLYYNDYNTHVASKADGIVRICQPIFEAGYLDGIGMQDHDGYNSPTAVQWIASYDKFYPICSEISVTELDVKPSSNTLTPTVLTQQANQYAMLFKCFVERSSFSGRGKLISVSKDGLNDEWAFVANASLWDADNQCKPAFYASVDVGLNYNALDSLLAVVEALTPEDYTTESWANLTDAAGYAEAAMAENYSYLVSAADALGEAKDSLGIAIGNLVSLHETEADKPVIAEAEAGDAGADYSILEEGQTTFASIQTNFINTGNPGSGKRMISFDVTFPDTGVYDLFARIRVGPNGYDDDSFFYGNGFGQKDSLSDGDWIISNGLASAGFSGADDIVYEAGGLGAGVWKWVNLSRNAYQGEPGIRFVLTDTDSLTRLFQIGAREDGLDIDKIAFGNSNLYFTVGNLDNGEPGSSTLPGGGWEGPPLASNQPKFVGNISSYSQEDNFEAYWNAVTPENAGKWGSVEGTRDVMNWGGLDAAYQLAGDNDFPFIFHVLVWGAQQPGWIDGLSTEDQLEEITEWFQAVADRYTDIDYLQVVNEPLYNHNPPDGTGDRANYKEALGGDGETGWDWVITAFQMARDIFPAETKLMLNDFNIINSPDNTSQYLKIINLLKAEGLIDVIGVQGHAFSTTAPVRTMEANLTSLAATGLPIQVTELDIDGVDDQVQLESYQRIFPALYEHPGVEGITLWGWRRGLWRDEQGAYIMNPDGSERPALEWMREYLDTLTIDPVSIVENAEKPGEFCLYKNYPNPFNPTTHIRYDIPSRSHVIIDVFDISGRHVRRLVDNDLDAGQYTAVFDGSDLSSGIYFYRIITNKRMIVKSMLLVK